MKANKTEDRILNVFYFLLAIGMVCFVSRLIINLTI